jgi:hypothetical protein
MQKRYYFRKIRLWIVDRQLSSLRKKMSKLRNQLIKTHLGDLKLVCSTTLAVVNEQPVDKKSFQENDIKVDCIRQKISFYMKKELELTHRHFELIGKPMRPYKPLKLI